MADPAETPAGNDDGTGRDTGTAVNDGGNDAFSDAFDSFASGGTPDPEEPNEEGQDDQAGQDGGDDDRGEEPPSEPGEDDRPAVAPGKPPVASTQETDLWSNLTPAQRVALDNLERAAKGSGKRASILQRQLNELQAKQPAQGPAAQQEEQGKEPSDAWTLLNDKIASFREDYPEIADVIIPLLEAQRDGLNNLNGRVAPVIAADEVEAVRTAQEQIGALHSDWMNYGTEDTAEYAAWLAKQPANVRTDNAAFRGWLGAQPQKVQALADSWDPQESAVVLTLFKAERAEAMREAGGGKPAAVTTDVRRQRQLDAGKVVGSRPGSAASGAPDDFTGAFEHFAKKAEAKA